MLPLKPKLSFAKSLKLISSKSLYYKQEVLSQALFYEIIQECKSTALKGEFSYHFFILKRNIVLEEKLRELELEFLFCEYDCFDCGEPTTSARSDCKRCIGFNGYKIYW